MPTEGVASASSGEPIPDAPMYGGHRPAPHFSARAAPPVDHPQTVPLRRRAGVIPSSRSSSANSRSMSSHARIINSNRTRSTSRREILSINTKRPHSSSSNRSSYTPNRSRMRRARSASSSERSWVRRLTSSTRRTKSAQLWRPGSGILLGGPPSRRGPGRSANLRVWGRLGQRPPSALPLVYAALDRRKRIPFRPGRLTSGGHRFDPCSCAHKPDLACGARSAATACFLRPLSALRGG
jgi:hypothetical protein